MSMNRYLAQKAAWGPLPSRSVSQGVIAEDHSYKPTATETDKVLLAEHGVEGLRQKKFFGVMDRLFTSGLISTRT